MPRIVVVVEGHGDVESVPIIVRRLVATDQPECGVEVAFPIRIPRHRIVKKAELERAVLLARGRLEGNDGGVLIVIDADDDCPAHLGPKLLGECRSVAPDLRVAVTLAMREMESWFLAAASSLAGQRGLSAGIIAPPDPETIRDAKGWLSGRLPGGTAYSPVVDQPALAALFDLDQAMACPSFRKFRRDVRYLVTGVTG